MLVISLIRFNDDNHAERIFINGKYVGTTEDITEIIKEALLIGRNCYDIEYCIRETSIYVCDDFEDYDEDDEMIDNIWDFFNNAKEITMEQDKLIQEKNWEELNKII